MATMESNQTVYSGPGTTYKKDKLCCVIYALMTLCLLSSCTEKSEMPIDNTPSSESPSRLEDVCLNSPKSNQELKKTLRQPQMILTRRQSLHRPMGLRCMWAAAKR